MSRKVREVTQRFFLCLAKLRKDFFCVSQRTQTYAKAFFMSRKVRKVTQRLVCLYLARHAGFRKGLFIIFFAVLASFARNFFYVSQRAQSFAKACLLYSLRS